MNFQLGVPWTPSTSVVEFWLAQSCAGLVQAQAAMNSCVQWVCHISKMLLHPGPPWSQAPMLFLLPPTCLFLSLRVAVIYMPHFWISSPWAFSHSHIDQNNSDLSCLYFFIMPNNILRERSCYTMSRHERLTHISVSNRPSSEGRACTSSTACNSRKERTI